MWVGRSFGIARHWHPVLKIYIIPFITSRPSTWRLLPPRLAGGINGSTYAHSSSARSLGYRTFAAVVTSAVLRRPHRGAPLESGHHFESQTIQRIQNVFGRTLRRRDSDAMMRITIVILALLLMARNDEGSPAVPPPISHWKIVYSPNMPAWKSGTESNWHFDFPNENGVHYVYKTSTTVRCG